MVVENPERSRRVENPERLVPSVYPERSRGAVEESRGVEVPVSRILQFRNKTYPLGKKTYLMAVLNITPDSFFDGGRFFDFDAAYRRTQEAALQGADFLDIGGQSSRPGSEPVAENEELKRTLPLIEKLKMGGITLVLIEHRLRELFKVADRVMALQFGEKIAEGHYKDVIGDPRVKEAYLGIEEI